MCIDCQSILVDDYGDEFCPLRECQGRVANVDEMIAPALIELNRKGYETLFSCSGHFNRKYLDNYVAFAEHVELTSAPEGFELEKFPSDEGMRTIVRLNLSEEEWEKFDQEARIVRITENNLALLRWAKGLPERSLE